jgi:hypothetical protein
MRYLIIVCLTSLSLDLFLFQSGVTGFISSIGLFFFFLVNKRKLIILFFVPCFINLTTGYAINLMIKYEMTKTVHDKANFLGYTIIRLSHDHVIFCKGFNSIRIYYDLDTKKYSEMND